MKITYSFTRGKFISHINGTIDSGFIEMNGIKEFCTYYRIENNYICSSHILRKARKEKGRAHDTVEEKTFNTYLLEVDDEISNRIVYKVKPTGQRTITYYTLCKEFSRLDGPCIVDSGMPNENSLFYCEPIEIWGFKGEIIPDWAPKLNGQKKIGNWDNTNILKSLLLFNRQYTTELMKYDKQMRI